MVQIPNKGSNSSVIAADLAPAKDPSPGADRARRRMETRRLEILRAAGRTFRRLGFATAGMREIAAEADLSPGNLYHYFKGKQEILFFCQNRFLDRMLETLETAAQRQDGIRPQLRSVFETHAVLILDELEGSAAHLEVSALPAELRDPIVSKRDRYEQGVRGLIQAGVDRKEFAPCDPGLVTRAILGALNWTAHWFDPGGSRPAEAVSREIVDYLLRGLDHRGQDHA